MRALTAQLLVCAPGDLGLGLHAQLRPFLPVNEGTKASYALLGEAQSGSPPALCQPLLLQAGGGPEPVAAPYVLAALAARERWLLQAPAESALVYQEASRPQA